MDRSMAIALKKRSKHSGSMPQVITGGVNHGRHYRVGTVACIQAGSEGLGECAEALADPAAGVRER